MNNTDFNPLSLLILGRPGTGRGRSFRLPDGFLPEQGSLCPGARTPDPDAPGKEADHD